ncbi:MAG: hypothetical protein ACRDRJ_22955, partial [Streptosporangiaceae bacterium]
AGAARRRHPDGPAARLAAVLAAAVLAALVAACGSGPPSPASPRAEAIAFMRAHPVAAVSGMTAGVIVTVDDAGFAGAAAREAGCPVALTAEVMGAVGSLPGCGAWLATAETAAGQVAVLSCGSIAARRECPLEERAGGYIPLPGDYVRFVTGGQIAAWSDIRVIEEFAVAALLAQASGSGLGWVTSPAGAG